MAKKTQPAMGLDDDQAPEATTTTTSISEPDPEPVHTEPAPVRQGEQHRPYCRRHHVLMSAYASREGVTRYKCPVPDCRETEKRARPRSVIPSEPHTCPHCAARSREADVQDPPPVHLEVDYSRSSFSMLVLACPIQGCRFAVKVPRPDIGVRSRLMRGRQEQVGDR